MINALEIRTSIVFNISFPNNSILSCFFFFVIDLSFLIAAVTLPMFIPAAELGMRTGTQTNEANVEIETKSVTIETKISKYSTYLNTYMSSYIFD